MVTDASRAGVREARTRPVLSGFDIHRRWVLSCGLIAALLLLLAQILFAPRFVAASEIGFDPRAGIVRADQVREAILSPASLAGAVARFGLADRTGGPERALVQLGEDLTVAQTDLANVFSIRYAGRRRSLVAPLVNDLAGRAVRPGVVVPEGGRVIAVAEGPVTPPGSMLVPLGTALLGGLVTALAVLLVRERRQPGLKGVRDAALRLDLPVTMMIPAVSAGETVDRADVSALPVVAPASDYARAFRRWLMGEQAAARSIAVCSSLAAEGKSTFAISLARTAALAGRKTVLVDCDGRMRAASIALGATERPGLIQLLEGDVALDEALSDDPASPLRVLGHSNEPAIVDLWSRRRSETLALTISELTRRFDLVVIDTPPLLALAEARQTAAMAEQVLLVARWRSAPVGAIQAALRLLAAKGIRPALALTFVRYADRRPSGLGDAPPTGGRLAAGWR